MEYALKIITPPAAEPVTLAEAQAHTTATDTALANMLTSLITAARTHLEAICGRAFVTQTWEAVYDKWPCGDVIELPRSPLVSVTSVTYIDKDLSETALGTSTYLVDTEPEPGRIVLAYAQDWPSVTLRPSGGIRVRFVAGYGDATKVPQPIKQAILLLVGQWMDNRENINIGNIVNTLPFAVDSLIAPYRVWM